MKKLFISSFFILIGIVGTSQETTTAKTTVKTGVTTEDELKTIREMQANLEQMLIQFNKQISAAQATMNKIEEVQKKLDGKMNELKQKDKQANFEMQRLMNQYNQAETTTSNVLKKLSDSKTSSIRKIE